MLVVYLTKLTAQGPRSRNRPNKSSALSLCTWLKRTLEKPDGRTLIQCVSMCDSTKGSKRGNTALDPLEIMFTG